MIQERSASTGAKPSIRSGLLAAIPSLRAFAMALTNDVSRADDLVQETILRAWQNQDRFEPGSNLGAWLFTILRNLFYSHLRRMKREVADPDGSYAAQLRTAPDQEAGVIVKDMWRALGELPPDQREALLLVGAEGMSYDEAAHICGVAVGTIKSRVNRARRRLAEHLEIEDARELGADRVVLAALQEGAKRR
jgi:RNA polymerase sigma-70 factor (ECF subfamily)